jgi:hypothetical protein
MPLPIQKLGDTGGYYKVLSSFPFGIGSMNKDLFTVNQMIVAWGEVSINRENPFPWYL